MRPRGSTALTRVHVRRKTFLSLKVLGSNDRILAPNARRGRIYEPTRERYVYANPFATRTHTRARAITPVRHVSRAEKNPNIRSAVNNIDGIDDLNANVIT